MSTPQHSSSRPTGASPAGGAPTGRKWLVPLIVGVVALIAIVLLLSRCGSDTDSDAPSATSATGSVSPAAAAPAATTTSAGTGSSTGTNAEGTVTVGGDDLLSAPTGIAQGGHDGDEAVGHAVAVQSVPADEGFWVGSSATDRLWVQLSGTRGESDYRVRQGDKVDFTGTVRAAGPGFPADTGLTAAEGAGQLTDQGHYISVPVSSVKLFR